MSRVIAARFAVGLVLCVTPPAWAQAPGLPPDSLLGRIRPEWIAASVRFLSDDFLRGRETAQPGAEIAARYVAASFGELGLVPMGPDSSFLVPVPLRRSTAVPERTTVTLTAGGAATDLSFGHDYFVHADKRASRLERSGGLVFVGWGVSAPELGYDDYHGIDARGKFAVMFFGGPPALPSDERGHYSTLAAKEQNALARGAVGVVTIIPGPPELVGDRLDQLENYAWLDPEGQPHSPFFETGLTLRLTNPGAERVLRVAGRSVAEVAEALTRGPVSFPIEARLDVRAEFSQANTSASNVAGMIPGRDPALRHEYLVYSAHLDHVGTRTPVDGDSVYHGAIDNAGGTAVLMALARAWAGLPRPRRSVIFLAVTGEEKGILGSDYFVHHPPVPREAIVADLNLDNFVMTVPVRDFTAYGARYSSLEDEARRAFQVLGVAESDDALPGMTIFTRSDHYPFMREGIPALMLFPGRASGRDGQTGVAVQRAWFDRIHHTPRDRADQGIDWRAGVTFAEANLLIGWAVANGDGRPQWRGRFFFHDPSVAPAGR